MYVKYSLTLFQGGTMDYKITGYEPAKLFHYFEEISAIPRGSGNEKGISDYLVHP